MRKGKLNIFKYFRYFELIHSSLRNIFSFHNFYYEILHRLIKIFLKYIHYLNDDFLNLTIFYNNN